MRHEDIPAGLSLCRSAGWNQQAEDWELFLKMNPHGCLVGIDERGKVIGTVTTCRYQHCFSWIGMVLVSPDRQREGIGTQLLNEALQLVPNNETIKLDATPAGRAVYSKLDFIDEYPINRMHIGPHEFKNLPSSFARAIEANDLSGILKLDREVFGADRQQVLQWNMKRAQELAFVFEEHGKVSGFCFGRRGYNFDHIGPIVATRFEVAAQLLSAAVRKAEGKAIVIDVPAHTLAWSEFVSSMGFTLLRPLIRMYRGSNATPGLPQKQFAILGPEFG
ncbi:MAG: GNAT family N-acetyltransferase [Phycisphaerae bacterium]|nr:GNAT family N-acetyltransferase [Saprospiraceae bacterium]